MNDFALYIGKFVLKGLIDIQSKNLNEKADLEQKIYDQDLVYEEMMERCVSIAAT